MNYFCPVLQKNPDRTLLAISLNNFPTIPSKIFKKIS